VPFEKTRHALARRSRLALVAWLAAAVAMGAWLAWALVTNVPLYETSVAARLETRELAYALESERAGRVVSSNLQLGRRVEQGELLLELDGAAVALELSEIQAELAGYRKTDEAMRAEISTLEASIDLLARQGSMEAQEIASRLRQATQARELALSQSQRASQLEEKGALSQAEAERARVEGATRSEEVSAVRARLNRTKAASELEANQLAVRIATLRRELAALATSTDTAQARAAQLELEIERRRIRAPTAGTVASVANIRVGSLLSAGESLGSIVPSGELKLVAEFDAEALGRIEPEQLARVRFTSLPWVEHGTVAARVEHVAQELLDGRLRVELGLDSTRLGNMQLRHGMTASVDVTVGEDSPMHLALRAIGADRTRSGH